MAWLGGDAGDGGDDDSGDARKNSDLALPETEDQWRNMFDNIYKA
jgi:hypothetical protein